VQLLDGLTGRRIAAARKELHLTQRVLAAELGVSLRTVQNYESGRFVPYRHLDALSRLLRRSSSWLLYGDERADADELLARSRQQRRELRRNLERLRELSAQLVAGGAPAHEIPHERR
jgi:transcriptional regulator with XRE-family HTH domain